MAALGRLGQLHQDTLRGPRMQEADRPSQALPRHLIYQGKITGLRLRQGGGDVRRLHAQVMNPLALLLQEARDASGWIGWLQQLDFILTDRQECRLHPLIRHHGLPAHGQPQDVPIKDQRCIKISNRHRDMMNSDEHAGTSLALNRAKNRLSQWLQYARAQKGQQQKP